jgi:hypothetical protein
MVFPVIGGDGKPTGYEIENSLRFNQGDHCLTQNFSGTESSNRKKWTFSVWFKRSNLITSAALFTAGSSGQDEMTIRLEQHKINWQEYKVSNSTMIGELITNQLLRDVSAWYHLVCRWDSTDSTAGDRMKIFLNGVEITSFATDNNPSENYDSMASNSVLHNVGRQSWNNASDFDGYMADVNFVEGLSLDASYFGETNNNGVWVPKKPNVSSYGNNGFFLEFQQTGTSQNSSGIGADTSGNDKHFAVSNLAATDVTVDTPTNNFATMNPLDNFYSAHTMSEGNVKFVTNGSGDGPFQTATIGDLKTGKWYFEFKYTDPAHTGGGDAAGEFYGQIGICGSGLSVATDAAFSSFEHNFAYDSSNGRIKFNNTAGTVHGASISADGQIIGFLIDLDNNRVTTHLNGQYADGSGNHDESSPTAYVSVTAPASTPLGGYMIAFGENVASSESGNQNTGTYEINFGNPAFAISSGNADANGYGNFEYAVPSGYYSLCTKNLAEYG